MVVVKFALAYVLFALALVAFSASPELLMVAPFGSLVVANYPAGLNLKSMMSSWRNA